jgi:osmotically inducible protein OsmC
MQRKATAVWRGDEERGKALLWAESALLQDTPYSYRARFETGVGTNSETRLAAAHAGCFALAVSSQMGKAGLMPGGQRERRKNDGEELQKINGLQGGCHLVRVV